jgi:cob(I)alamin adenosyltransferase
MLSVWGVAMEEGMLQVYTGDGKGKTTAALGLALRSVGHGHKVYMIQFMKGGWDYGELKAAENLPNLTIVQFGRPEFVDPRNPDSRDVELAERAMAHAREVIDSQEYDVVILDEINVAVAWNLVSLEEVLEMIRDRSRSLEMILTGRYAPERLMEEADLVTEMKEIRHPWTAGKTMRKGIDY